MKKVMFFFLLLLVACMGFAEEKTLQVTLEIADIPVEVAFTANPYTDPQKKLEPGPDVDLGTIDGSATKTASVWASAKTNSANPLTMEIYGTALTRKSGESYTEETLPLTLSISESTESKNSSEQTGKATFKKVYESGYTWGDAVLGLTLVEGATDGAASGTAGMGTRALTWHLTFSAKVEAGDTPTAGSYESYIWLVADSGGTGP